MDNTQDRHEVRVWQCIMVCMSMGQGLILEKPKVRRRNVQIQEVKNRWTGWLAGHCQHRKMARGSKELNGGELEEKALRLRWPD